MLNLQNQEKEKLALLIIEYHYLLVVLTVIVKRQFKTVFEFY